MFKISGPGVYRRRNGEEIEIAKFSKSDIFSVWLKKGSEYTTLRELMEFYDSFLDNGRCDAQFCTPFDLVECVKIVSTPEANHTRGCPSPDASASLPPGYEANVIESKPDRLGPHLRYRGEILVNDSLKIEDAVQFVIQKCGIPAVTEALILSRNPKVAFLKLFGDAVSMTVKRGIHSNAEVKVTFL